jgi:hypothetical protein
MASTTVAIIQSNYIPWKGYFDIIHDADLFIFYDDVQFTKQDWRTRNRIKMNGGSQWLSVPVRASINARICDAQVAGTRWSEKHYRSLEQNYRQTPYFDRYRPFLDDIYRQRQWSSLSELNQTVITRIAREHLGISTEIRDSRAYACEGSRGDRVVDLLGKVGATRYVSGPSAQAYLDAGRFEAAGIELVYKDYTGYPEYLQPYPPFDHYVSILDLLFCVGPAAPSYIWGWRSGGIAA